MSKPLLPPLLPICRCCHSLPLAPLLRPAPMGPHNQPLLQPCRKNLRGREDMGDVLDVVEFAAAQLPGPDKQVAVIG